MAWWHRSFCVGWISLQCMLLVSVDTLFCAAKRETHYDVLGVRKSASEQDIKKAFRRAALENHPDKKPEGPERDAALKEAQAEILAEAANEKGVSKEEQVAAEDNDA